MEENDFEWVSVSEMAKREGVSSQMIYMRIKQGIYETMNFTRGTMNGVLIKTAKQK